MPGQLVRSGLLAAMLIGFGLSGTQVAAMPLVGGHRTGLVSTGVAHTDALVYQRCRGPVRQVREPDPIRFDETSPVAPALTTRHEPSSLVAVEAGLIPTR